MTRGRCDQGMTDASITNTPGLDALERYRTAMQDYAECVRRELWATANAARNEAERAYEELVRILLNARL